MTAIYGHQERRHALIPCLFVDRCAALDQEIDDIFVLDLHVDGVVQRRHMVLVDGCHVRFQTQDLVDQLEVAFRSCRHKDSLPTLLAIDADVLSDELLDAGAVSLDRRGRLAAVNGCVQRRRQVRFLEVHALAGHLFEDTLDKLIRPVARRPLQCLAIVRPSWQEVLLCRFICKPF